VDGGRYGRLLVTSAVPAALFLPTMFSMYFLILTGDYFADLLASLEALARIDGASDFVILFRIILPSAKPISYPYVQNHFVMAILLGSTRG
jgi:putative aldouronate transport system permease protein